MQIHLLGYSEATISRILDSLVSQNYAEEVVIVQNMEVDEKIPFCPPGIQYKKLFWNEWKFDPARHKCIPALVTPSSKMKVVDFFKRNCLVEREHYLTLHHSSAVIASTVTVGEGSFIEPGTVLASFARIGFAVYVNRGCTIGHHTEIGDYLMTGPGVHIAGHCKIGAGVRLGIGSLVFDHVNIGENTIIGGGSVVTKDIPANVIAWGNPCKVIKNISE